MSLFLPEAFLKKPRTMKNMVDFVIGAFLFVILSAMLILNVSWKVMLFHTIMAGWVYFVAYTYLQRIVIRPIKKLNNQLDLMKRGKIVEFDIKHFNTVEIIGLAKKIQELNCSIDKAVANSLQDISLDKPIAGKNLLTLNPTERLRFDIEMLNKVLEVSKDIIFVKDREYRIVLCNQNLVDMYPGCDRDDILGTTTAEHFTNQKEVELFLREDRRAFEEGISDIYETLIMPDGQQRTFHSVKTRFYTTSSNQPYILGVSRDETNKQSMIKKLKETNEELDSFAYVASHDLKSPLNAIKKLASWIEDDCKDVLPPDSLKHFDMLKGRVNRMTQLLNDLLSYSRIGRFEYEYAQLDLCHVCSECLKLIDSESKIDLHCPAFEFYLPKLPVEILLTNLISNAVKHGIEHDNKIHVSGKDIGKEYVFVVKDTGPGIPVEYHEKVFEKFKTLRPRDEVEGSGMGLSIVKKIVENYNGSIRIDPDYKDGAKFIINWPKSDKL